jgi:hypothetical protein
MGPRCSSAETQVCHRSYIIAAKFTAALNSLTSIRIEDKIKSYLYELEQPVSTTHSFLQQYRIGIIFRWWYRQLFQLLVSRML